MNGMWYRLKPVVLYWLALVGLVAVGLVLFWPSHGKAQFTTPIVCNATSVYDASTNGSTRLVVGVQGRATYICGFIIYGGGTASVKFISGTGTTCATGSANLTPAFAIIVQSHVEDQASNFRGLYVDPLVDVCINTSAGVPIQALLYWTQR